MLPLSSSPRLRSLLISLLVAAALLVYAALSAEPVLRVSVVSGDAPPVTRRKLIPLTDYLEKRIGMKIEFRVMANEEAMVTALLANKLDIVWFSGYDLVQARLRSHGRVIPIAQRAEDAQTRSVFFTARRDINALSDLKGRVLAVGNKTSVSDYLMPRAFLSAADIRPDTEISYLDHADLHDEIAAVADGRADAGVLGNAAWEKLIAEGRADIKGLRVFYITPVYHDFNWAVRAGMDLALRQKLTDAFMSLSPLVAEEKGILDLQQASRFIPDEAGNYAAIELQARDTGLLKGE